jgi:pimeloyl-ACP methyl ester carboxylesterase/DNA-binding transcriptional ArsR family regulator
MTVAEDQLDATFTALADPTRRAILARLAIGDATVNELAAPFDMTLPGISKHLKMLERCGLISRTRRAQFRPCHLEGGALDAAVSWIEQNRRIWKEQFDKLDEHLRDIQDDRTARRAHDSPIPEPKEMGMDTVNSPDGTKIAYDRQGEGPTLILVDGAMCTRSFGSKPELVKLLAPHFTVYSYDRRGRGDSGDTLPYAVDREIEDIETLIDGGGGSAFLYGHSSGASLAMQAAIKLGGKVRKLAMYEAPYNDDPEAQRTWSQYIRQLTKALADGRRGDAAALFMNLVGMPADQIDGMMNSPEWPSMEAVAPTLAYDHTAILGEHSSVPTELAARVPVPTLVMHGGASFPFMGETARALSRAMPHAELRTLPGQTHEMNPAALAPVLVEFFAS